MLVLEFKLKGKVEQFRVMDERIRTSQFVRNKALRYWMDNWGVKLYDLNKYCAVLAKEFEWADKLNSMARQASAERAAFAIKRFYANCKAKKQGLKGYPRFKKNTHSVEYKTSGWKLSSDKRSIAFTDGFKAGSFQLIGSRDLHYYALAEIKRVRVVRRADGYFCQLCIDAERNIQVEPTGKAVGIDVGLKVFYADSDGEMVENPRHIRKAEKGLKRTQRRVSKRKKGSKNRRKAIRRLGKKHLKVSRRRKDFAVKTARALVLSRDFIAYEDLKVSNLVKNHKLAKSISDVAWLQFRQWLEYLSKVYGKVAVAVPPHHTSTDCSKCGTTVKKTLSTRTHVCPKCGTVLDRDHNAAINILIKALRQASIDLSTVGHTGTNAWGQLDLCLGGETPSGKPSGKTNRKARSSQESHA